MPSFRLLGIAGRPLPGIMGFLSARGHCSFRGIVICHSLKGSPPSSRRGFSEGITKSNSKGHFSTDVRIGAHVHAHPHSGRCRLHGGKPSGCCRRTLSPGMSTIASFCCQAPGQDRLHENEVIGLLSLKNMLAGGLGHLGLFSSSSSGKPE